LGDGEVRGWDAGTQGQAACGLSLNGQGREVALLFVAREGGGAGVVGDCGEFVVDGEGMSIGNVLLL